MHPHRFALNSAPFYAWYDLIYDKPWMRFGGLLGVTGAFLTCYHGTELKRFLAHPRLVTTLCVLFLDHRARQSDGLWVDFL